MAGTVLQDEGRLALPGSRIFCYTRPLLVNRPVYAGVQTLAACLVEAGTVPAAVLRYLLEQADGTGTVCCTLSRIATELGMPASKQSRITVWKAIEKLSAWWLLERIDGVCRYAPLLTIREAEIVMGLSGLGLDDVHAAVLTVNQRMALDSIVRDVA